MGIRTAWNRSTLLRVSTVLGVITLLAITVVITAAVFAEQSAGKGVAINLAGSLRMQSYLLATRVAAADVDPAERERLIRREIEAFETRLLHPQLTGALPGMANNGRSELARAHQRIAAQWREEIKPLAQRAAGDEAARALLLTRIHVFVAAIDRFVLQLESDLESRIHGLQVALGAALFVTLVLVISAVFLLDVEVFQPVRDLVRCAQEVRSGNFNVRAEDTGPDELGQLGADFNHMIDELGRLYGSLEAQIAAKTADLEQKNRALALLYETTRELAQSPLRRESLQRVAESVRRVLAVDGVVICARDEQTRGGFPLAHAETTPGRTCDLVRCEGCDDPTRIVWHNADSERGPARIVSVPLLDGERSYGVMPLTLVAGQEFTPAQIELAQVIGRHVASALAAEQGRDEHRRLALLEERSAIARELHDSIAQSLSYTKIQLARLSALVGPGASGAEAREVVAELRTGVSTAYRQLRELLTTFRLQLSGKGLRGALAQVVDDLRARSGLDIELHDELVGVELSANEQIHVLQIVREALANVEHHARAQHAWVRVLRGDGEDDGVISASIEDDGIGVGAATSPRHHFGLSIMRDRARALGGTIEIGARAPRGTCVKLRFVPLSALTEAHGTAVARLHREPVEQ
jgi:two-component system nitrate/nitrite sensor histidine kinase NarX